MKAPPLIIFGSNGDDTPNPSVLNDETVTIVIETMANAHGYGVILNLFSFLSVSLLVWKGHDLVSDQYLFASLLRIERMFNRYCILQSAELFISIVRLMCK